MTSHAHVLGPRVIRWAGLLATSTLLVSFASAHQQSPPRGAYESLLAYAGSAHELQRDQEALAALEEASEQRADDPELYLRIAEACRALGEWDRGNEALRRAVALDPKLVDDERQKQLHAGLSFRLRPLAMMFTDKQRVDGYRQLGRQAFELGRYREAMVLFTDAVAIRNDDANLHFYIAQCALALGDRQRGTVAIDRLVALRPVMAEQPAVMNLRSQIMALPDAAPAQGNPETPGMPLKAAMPDTGTVAMACAVARQLMAEYRLEQNPAEQRALMERARERLRPVLSDPRMTELEPWRLAGVAASMLEDEELAPYAFEAIERLAPGFTSDPNFLSIMAKLELLAPRPRIVEIRRQRDEFLQILAAEDAIDDVAVGNRFCKGLGVPKDTAKALTCFTRAAELGSKEGMFELAELLYLSDSGIGGPGTKKALSWYEKAVAAGHTRAMSRLGIIYLFRQTCDDAEGPRAIELLTAAANAGDVAAMRNLGEFFDTLFDTTNWLGEDEREDDTTAFGWYSKAAAAGDLKAMESLARLYREGRGTRKDEAKADELAKPVIDAHTRAADAGDVEAMMKLGDIFWYGLGVAEDKAKAFQSYMRAAKASPDQWRAMNQIGAAYCWGDGVVKDFELSIEWYTRALDAGGGTTAMIALSYAYDSHARSRRERVKPHDPAFDEEYEKAERDEITAFQWISRAASGGDAGAMHLLGERYRFGRGVEEDGPEAVKWYTAAYAAGHHRSASDLAMLYDPTEEWATATGLQKSDARAFEWYLRSAKSGVPGHMVKVAEMAEAGRGTRKDAALALEWYTRAARVGWKEAQDVLRSRGRSW